MFQLLFLFFVQTLGAGQGSKYGDWRAVGRHHPFYVKLKNSPLERIELTLSIQKSYTENETATLCFQIEYISHDNDSWILGNSTCMNTTNEEETQLFVLHPLDLEGGLLSDLPENVSYSLRISFLYILVPLLSESI
eukprot:TRINITY_DN4553_c0_g2_i5.p1 TRINITY_DN4553_c0_g2~~TRINITY_DN4553_c0_g2_i5.p1  ORF type:complete len:136 (-),score=13.28 TRINITY_DN4553_c0_g2_i5:881-1288(-)